MKEQKRKIAFVIVRYGKDINGGAEVHCKMLAERLTEKYQVEVLTTCVKDYKEGTNVYPIGEEKINGVLVRRFKASPLSAQTIKKPLGINLRSIRTSLYKKHLLAPIANIFPIWN